MQLGLNLNPVKSKDLLLSERFLVFHYTIPQVYDALVRLARRAVGRGKKRIGIGMLWEVMRWEMGLDVTVDGDEFKLNNSSDRKSMDCFRSRYSGCAPRPGLSKAVRNNRSGFVG